MKIGLVLPGVPKYSETFFMAKITGLIEAGHEVVLFVKNPKGKENFICPVHVHPRFAKNKLVRLVQTLAILVTVFFRAARPAFRLYRVERNQKATIAQALQSVAIASSILPHKLNWLHFGFITTALQRELIAKAIGAKMATSIRGYDIAVVPIKTPNCYSKVWHNLDKLHTISTDLLELAYANGLRQETKVAKITPAIQVKQFEAAQQLDANKPLNILSVGRLHWKKGFEYTLQALAMLKAEGVKFVYSIAGEGDELERLQFAVQQLGLADEVQFLGKLTHKQVALHMQQNSIYVQYSMQEGFCNSVLEAQASNMLCFVSNAEGLPENVIDGQTGWVAPKRKPALLANKIKEALALTDAERERIRVNARKRVEDHFTVEDQINKFVAFYED